MEIDDLCERSRQRETTKVREAASLSWLDSAVPVAIRGIPTTDEGAGAVFSEDARFDDLNQALEQYRFLASVIDEKYGRHAPTLVSDEDRSLLSAMTAEIVVAQHVPAAHCGLVRIRA